MRASSASLQAVDVWDVLVASITGVGSIGEVLDDLTAAKIAFIDQAISTPPFTEYTYNAALAAAATYEPAAKTIVMVCTLGVNQKLNVVNGADTVRRCAELAADERGYIGSIYCDGTDIGFKNTDGAQQTLDLKGWTMA